MSRNHELRGKPVTTVTAALVLAVVTAFTSTDVESKSQTFKTTKTQPGDESIIETGKGSTDGRRVVSLTFKEMGAWSAVNLRGIDASRTLNFAIRADEVVVGAKLRLGYDYSPALIPELSHLRLLLNERIVATEGLPKDKGMANSREINLDPRLFAELNTLRFNLIGHYTRQCENPFHSSLWLTLSDLSRLELTLAPVSKTNDLRQLPAPFFDKRENTQLKLPFVFAGTPSFGALKAAGVVASWFGLQASYRGAQFPVTLNAIPDGNAVVFMQANDSIDGITGKPGATVSIQTHPTNPRAKLLLVTGSTDEEFARAARSIALIAPTLAGQMVTITKETEAAPRKPYDAPAWIPTDRAVRFGEIAKLEELRVQGYYPEVVRLNYRVPPDVFSWRSQGTPVNLKYRATRLPLHKNSSLNVSLNTNFIQTFALNEPEKSLSGITPQVSTEITKSGLREESLFLPPYATLGRDQLQLSYFFDVIKERECGDLPPDNLQASIDAESTIDFSSFPHYVALPNLAYFSSLGFPFTRMADLSETAVVLPERPNADELALYLALMGRMGEATAYPALRHAVISAADVDKMSARDLIVIGSASSQSLMNKWANHLPMVQVNGERQVREPDDKWLPAYRWEQKDVVSAALPRGSLVLTGGGNLAAAMAFESPLQAKRSVVFLFADKAADLRKISDALIDPERATSIQGDFAVIDDKLIDHAKVGSTYYLGALPNLSKLSWFLSDQPWLLSLLGLLTCVVAAALVYRPLRRLVTTRTKKTS
jgi:hypothetical protein